MQIVQRKATSCDAQLEQVRSNNDVITPHSHFAFKMHFSQSWPLNFDSKSCWRLLFFSFLQFRFVIYIHQDIVFCWNIAIFWFINFWQTLLLLIATYRTQWYSPFQELLPVLLLISKEINFLPISTNIWQIIPIYIHCMLLMQEFSSYQYTLYAANASRSFQNIKCIFE